MSVASRVRMLNILLHLLQLSVCLNGQKIEIISKFNGLVNEGDRGVIAVKTAGDPIESCIWTSPQGSSYEINRGSSSAGRVEITERASLCKLSLNSASSRTDDGTWKVEVVGKCEFYSKATTYSTFSSPVPFTTTGSDDSAINFKPALLKKGIGEDLKVDRDGCANVAEMGINLMVLDSSAFEVAPAQEKVFGFPGSPSTLTMRSNREFFGCKGSFKRSLVVEMRNQQRSCATFEQAEICLEYYYDRSDNIYSCILLIDRFNSNLEGPWEIELSYRIGRRDEVKSNVIDLAQGRLPTSVILTHDNLNIEYPFRKGDKSAEELKLVEGQTARVECRVLGGIPEPSPILQINRNKFVELKAVNPCRNPPRGESCQEFEFNVVKDLDRQELQCGYTMPLYDLSPREQESNRATGAISLGRDGRINNNDSDDIRLINSSASRIEVCDPNLRIGDRLTLEFKFETRSRPFEIEWEMSYQTRFPTIVRYNSATSGYRNMRYRTEGRDTYTAILEIDRISSSDLDNDHLVTIENDARVRRDFIVNLSNSQSCDGRSPCSFGDRDCFCNRNRDKCCDNARGCRSNCCFICDPRRDRDCECDGDLCCDNSPLCRGDTCCEKVQETLKGCDPFEDGRDCICDGRRENCCLLTPNCSGPNCCTECDDRKDEDCLICYRSQCYKVKGSIKGDASDLFIHSCLDLSKIILTQFNPDGSDRQRETIDQAFRRELEDFFNTVRCTGYDKALLTKLEKTENLSAVFFGPRLGAGLNAPVATFKSASSDRNSSIGHSSTTPSSMTQQAQDIINFKLHSSSPDKQRVNNKIFGNGSRRTSATGSEAS